MSRSRSTTAALGDERLRQLAAAGHSDREIGDRYGTSANTIRGRRERAGIAAGVGPRSRPVPLATIMETAAFMAFGFSTREAAEAIGVTQAAIWRRRRKLPPYAFKSAAVIRALMSTEREFANKSSRSFASSIPYPQRVHRSLWRDDR